MSIAKIPALKELSFCIIEEGGREKGKIVNRQ